MPLAETKPLFYGSSRNSFHISALRHPIPLAEQFILLPFCICSATC